jgi:hemerythrin-like metal-binding protein
MAIIDWTAEFELGIPDIDTEHRELIALINELHADIGDTTPSADIVLRLQEIYRQIADHFAHEEQHMRDSRYMSYAEHKEDHEILLDDLRDIIKQVETVGRYPEERLAADLKYWFSGHFRTHDARLHRVVDR